MSYEQAGYTDNAPYNPKNLLARTDGATTRKVTIASGNTLVAGAVIGEITASSKYILSLAAAEDGSETPDLVLAQDVDASDGDVEALAYEHATVVASALTLGTGHTIDSIREVLRGKGIYIDD